MRDRNQRAAWLARFDDPSPLPKGGWIKMLGAARAHMLRLSEREQLEPRWQDAAKYVLRAVEERPWIFFARSAIYAAVYNTDKSIPPAPDVKKPEYVARATTALAEGRPQPDGFEGLAGWGLSAVAWGLPRLWATPEQRRLILRRSSTLACGASN
jgi:hypothetical protein